MNLSEAGSQLLIDREGFKNKAYKDTKGIWTIGVGHTGKDVTPTSVWTDEKVREVFQEDVKWAVDAVNSGVAVSLTQNQFDALVSFTFNVGKKAFLTSTMLRLINQGDFPGAAEQFNRWVIPKEITGRRMSEKRQFENG